MDLDDQVSFVRRFPSGDAQERSSLQYFLGDLLLYLPTKKLPPLFILNQYLSRGIVDWGMSGGLMWEKFALSKELYSELLERLHQVPEALPSWVKDELTWSAWCFQDAYGLPSDQYLALEREARLLRNELEKAHSRDDDAKIADCENAIRKNSKSMFELEKEHLVKRSR